MRLLDRKRGRIFGINLIDAFIIFIVIFGIGSYISKPSDENVYRGNQMYSAIQDHQRLDSRGFLVEGVIEGIYLWDRTPFKETGIILPSSAGRLRLRNANGDVFVIGGEQAYIEDVAASSINLKPIDNYLVLFNIDSLTFDDYPGLITYLRSIKNNMQADHLYLDIEIAVDSDKTPSEKEMITNQMKTIYLVRDTYLSRTEPGGFVINILKGEVDELANLSIDSMKLTTGRARAYAGYEQKPDRELEEGYHLISSTEV